jgi:hypothetical protein
MNGLRRKENMRTSLTLIALLGLLAGCATPPPQVGTYVNPLTGGVTDVTDTMLVGPGTPREVVYLTCYHEKNPSGEPRYYLSVKYIAPVEVGYLEIPPGQTLTIVADGNAIKLDGSGSLNTRQMYKHEGTEFVTELAQYPISRLDLQKIGYARKLQAQIKGNKLLIERDFVDDNYDKIRAFVTRTAL